MRLEAAAYARDCEPHPPGPWADTIPEADRRRDPAWLAPSSAKAATATPP
jgi:hypothetical protein